MVMYKLRFKQWFSDGILVYVGKSLSTFHDSIYYTVVKGILCDRYEYEKTGGKRTPPPAVSLCFLSSLL